MTLVTPRPSRIAPPDCRGVTSDVGDLRQLRRMEICQELLPASLSNVIMRHDAAWIAAATLALAGCATTAGPDVTVDYDRTADLASYKTYGFPEDVGTDRAGYSTLVTGYFKDAVNREMQRR